MNRPARPAPRTAARPASRRTPPGEVRLIGGLWKRSKLPVPDRPGLRPTPDRVKETLFNWLGQDLGGWRVLDAFAGTGALGFEAASRGAAEVVLLERDPALAHSLEATRQRLGAGMARIERTDALAWMARCAPGRFELVLLDPPFDAELAVPATLVAAPLACNGGFVYLESGQPLAEPPPGLVLYRHLKAGAVHAQLFRRQG
ncbi:MAG: 16S rRNA (guanine(966)-N(2))-methyltransferase RsmD [Rubrivivax sp.]|nr:16S rRNA (guanine(966)-N(2))-methyltransferase RsmD [Betaproteobacteria bacterium]MBP6319653.1 16S rRNA (guanine(966)-N(2))-methyltransferase RsmD [Rubrivivax sp.]MBK7277059.1 16S rRNA (guanine(966)-N(2))-methyltransferase RsmD [Betaproteobacteria bacterium]MBK7461251.1 16S rRNA (guanine(966)-N(2))-methyltransferase RsmD [Betaproteobacteria bacterium]MBK7515758.1 16S rRNA (guanine(966)-N(2))-methyltransferase RsmD [Betaproteobacteria bacterium]